MPEHREWENEAAFKFQLVSKSSKCQTVDHSICFSRVTFREEEPNFGFWFQILPSQTFQRNNSESHGQMLDGLENFKTRQCWLKTLMGSLSTLNSLKVSTSCFTICFDCHVLYCGRGCKIVVTKRLFEFKAIEDVDKCWWLFLNCFNGHGICLSKGIKNRKQQRAWVQLLENC